MLLVKHLESLFKALFKQLFLILILMLRGCLSSQGDENQATSKHKPDSVFVMRAGLEFHPWPWR